MERHFPTTGTLVILACQQQGSSQRFLDIPFSHEKTLFLHGKGLVIIGNYIRGFAFRADDLFGKEINLYDIMAGLTKAREIAGIHEIHHAAADHDIVLQTALAFCNYF